MRVGEMRYRQSEKNIYARTIAQPLHTSLNFILFPFSLLFFHPLGACLFVDNILGQTQEHYIHR